MIRKFLVIAGLLITGKSGAQFKPQDTTLTDAKKLYGLSLFWQEANYNFAYFDNVPHLNWDSAYQAFIPKVLATSNRFEYYQQLRAFCALLKDGHTNVYFPQDIQQRLMRRSFGNILLELRNIDSRAVVVNVARSNKDLIPVGSEIIEVNGLPVQQYIAEFVRPYISQSAEYMLDDYCIDYLLEGFEGSSVTISYRKPSGVVDTRVLTRKADQQTQWLNPYPYSLFVVQPVGDGILRIELNSFGNASIIDSFKAALPRIREAKGVIIDLRRNGGGSSSTGAAILAYFTDSLFIRGSKWQTRQHRGAYKAWGFYAAQEPEDTSQWAKEATDYFYGRMWYEGGRTTIMNQAPKGDRMPRMPLAVLMGHGTASAAEDFLIMLDGLRGRAVTIGQRSFASTGQPLMMYLPGGGQARICTKKDTYPDGRVFVGNGIKPDIEINPTLEDYLSQKDRALEEAIKQVKAAGMRKS